MFHEQILRFGYTDLTIDFDFNSCSSTLESSYGIGLPDLSDDNDSRDTFLAGSKFFKIIFLK